MTLSLSDEDFGKLVSGKTQAQRLFMSGKLKIKGDVMKVYYMNVANKGRWLIGHTDRLPKWNQY